MNASIVTIGTNHFLLPNAAKASKLVELLAGSIQVDYEFDHTTGRRAWQTVDHDRRAEARVSLEVVKADEIQKPIPRVPKSRRLGFTPSLPDFAG